MVGQIQALAIVQCALPVEEGTGGCFHPDQSGFLIGDSAVSIFGEGFSLRQTGQDQQHYPKK